MYRRVLALCGGMLALCLSAGAQVPAGFLQVSQSNLTDASGNLISNATICAQAMVGSSVASIQVNGSGTVAFRSNCAPVVNGAWSMNLPDMSLSQPRYAGVALTITDDVSGASLLSGYSYVQPRSTMPKNQDSTTFWCSSTGCSLDKLAPNYPASDAFVAPQGVQGIPGQASVVTSSGTAQSFTVGVANGSVTPGAMLAGANTNGMLNEELFPGSSVAARVNAAASACGSSYTSTCLIQIPSYAPSGTGWSIPSNNVTILDQRNLNGFGYPDGELAGMRGNLHYVYHAGTNDPNETSCTFCGKNLMILDAVADGGQTTNGSNASLQSLVSSVHRMAGSDRQVWAINAVTNVQTLDQIATGLEVDTSNESGSDDAGLNMAGVRVINNGNHAGIGLQINGVRGDGSDGLPAIRGYYLNQDMEDYHFIGAKFHTADPNKAADLYIVPGADDTAPSVRGRNAADTADSWSVDDSGNAAFAKITGRLQVIAGVSNNTGLQHWRGTFSCSSATNSGAACASPNLPLPVAMVDTSYTLSCQVTSPTSAPAAVTGQSKGTTVVNVVLGALTGAGVNGSYGYDCIAIHD